MGFYLYQGYLIIKPRCFTRAIYFCLNVPGGWRTRNDSFVNKWSGRVLRSGHCKIQRAKRQDRAQNRVPSTQDQVPGFIS